MPEQTNLFPENLPQLSLALPEQPRFEYKHGGNPIKQLVRPSQKITAGVRIQKVGRRSLPSVTHGGNTILITTKSLAVSVPSNTSILKLVDSDTSDPQQIIEAAELPESIKKWQTPPGQPPLDTGVDAGRIRTEAVVGSWKNTFHYREEDAVSGAMGLRNPQLGALHAILAHWTVLPEEPATVVMPTGTGKTETMLSLLINQRLNHLLVVVPTNALRDQIARKFETLGILPGTGVVGANIQLPIVGKVKHGFTSAEEAEGFIKSCNVVVATMAAINACSEEVRTKIAELCPNLIIDEAHHVSAPSWDLFKQQFAGKPILQFTATPFRNDGKYVGGKIIYAYPLAKAQIDGYFTKINFLPVFAYFDEDKAIAEQAIETLNQDVQSGYDHIVMARVSSIERAEAVHGIYQQLAPDHNPLLIHSKMTEAQKKDALRRLDGPGTRSSRIIVCVDMLGEGFDLPELKIAAMHDIHKSLAITLQFTGRFTRIRHGGNLGEAKVIVNIADTKVNKQIKDLYAEDADWNKLISQYSQTATGAEQQRSDFLHGFVSLPDEISVQNIEPRMSTVVYKSQATDWEPDTIKDLFPEEMLYTKEIAINREHKVAWFVTEQHTKLKWANIKGIDNITYDIYVIHWNADKNLLFINSSNNSSVHEDLAKAVVGDQAAIIRGAEMYRSMHQITRMVPINLGLTDITSRTTRFTMFAGSDVGAGLDQSQTRNKTKTNMFGFGYENGEKVSIGCSQKGRVWSYLAANDIGEWIAWCNHVGTKLTDDSINLDDIYGSLVRPQPLTVRPPFVPLTVEWPLYFLLESDHIVLRTSGGQVPLHDVSLEVTTHTNSGPLKFNVVTPTSTYEYEIVFSDEKTAYRAVGTDVVLVKGQTEKPLSDWLNARPVKIIFEGDRIVEDDFLFEYNSDVPPFDAESIEAWDWSGVDIRKESQRLTKRPDSIQRRVIEKLLEDADWDIIFDDDGSGEAADVVAIKVRDDKLIVRLYHCKFSGESIAGARIDDFYAVCGQAQKSVFWREHPDRLIPHLIQRAKIRDQNNQTSRFERGDYRDLSRIGWREAQMDKDFKAIIVQPGLAKSQVSPAILQVLGASSLFLRTTLNVELQVISSE